LQLNSFLFPPIALHLLQFLLEMLSGPLIVLFLLAAGLVNKMILVGLVQLVNELLDVCFILIEPVLVFPLHKPKSICSSTIDSLMEGPPFIFQAVMFLFGIRQGFLETLL